MMAEMHAMFPEPAPGPHRQAPETFHPKREHHIAPCFHIQTRSDPSVVVLKKNFGNLQFFLLFLFQLRVRPLLRSNDRTEENPEAKNQQSDHSRVFPIRSGLH